MMMMMKTTMTTATTTTTTTISNQESYSSNELKKKCFLAKWPVWTVVLNYEEKKKNDLWMTK